MKTCVALLLFLFSLSANGQEDITPKPVSEWPPLFYLDSVNVEMSKLLFDANKLSAIKVTNNYYDSSMQIHGKVFMTSKDPKNYNFLTISQILRPFKKEIQTPTIFMLDNEILKDTSNFKIDSSYILKVLLLQNAENKYSENTMRDSAILKIITRTKKNPGKHKQIRIRGAQSIPVPHVRDSSRRIKTSFSYLS